MLKRLCLVLVLCLLMLPVIGLRAQDDAMPLAVEYENSLWVLHADTLPRSMDALPSALILVSADPAYHYFATWSPDGTKLAYVVQASPDAALSGVKLKVWDGHESIDVTDIKLFNIDAMLSWTKDGRIAYQSYSGAAPTEFKAAIYTVAPEAGAVPQVVAENLPAVVDCSIGMLDPRESMAWRELGTQRMNALVAATPYGAIYPASCFGSQLSLVHPGTGEVVALAGGNLSRAVLSPDESRLAGIEYDAVAGIPKLVVVDLTTMAAATLNTTGIPTLIAWGDDGSLYYSAEPQTRSLLDNLTDAQKDTLRKLLNVDELDQDFYSGHTVQLYHRALDGTETLLHEQDAYAVSRLFKQGSLLVYSTVPNGDAWVQAMADGTLKQDTYYGDAAMKFVPVSVNVLPLNADGMGGEVLTLPGDLRRLAVAP